MKNISNSENFFFFLKIQLPDIQRYIKTVWITLKNVHNFLLITFVISKKTCRFAKNLPLRACNCFYESNNSRLAYRNCSLF